MSPESIYCPECRKMGVIATVAGPSCTHQQKHDVSWWPANWGAMQEQERVEWIWVNRTNAK